MNDRLDSRAADETALTRDVLERARLVATERGGRVMEALEECAELPPDRFVAVLARQFGTRVLTMQGMQAMTPRFDLIPFPESLRRECVLLDGQGEGLTLATGDPFDLALRAWAEERVPAAFAIAIAHRDDLGAFLHRYEDGMRAMDSLAGLTETAGPEKSVEDLSIRSISDDASPVVKLVNSTLYDALKLGASDVHLETSAEALNIKYRLDGVLSIAGRSSGGAFAEQVISRVKVMAELDIAERRVPQDGRFKIAARGREIDVRVSIMPSIHGEDAVLRILDKQALADQVLGLRLEALGFAPAVLTAIRELAVQPYGMLLVTGPTGSGKTTTLYAALSEINRGIDKIVTIEDPVEYQLPGVLQIPVNEKKGLTFARGLRSILRHDPDKIMVGEIRDPETAQIAVQAALTGHLVFTTVHANNVFDVIGRFTHMAVEPQSFMSALNGIVAQRLMRVNCPHCSIPVESSCAELQRYGLEPARQASLALRAGRGCGQCRGSGYRGRRAIAEVLLVDDELRELIAAREPPRRIKSVAQARGFRSLRAAALDLVVNGESTFEELNRVTLAA
ncbi:MAG: GspE/PulE family protein [Burkholderiales bacterium]